MCRRESWRGFTSEWIQGELCVIEQCTACGDYRARSVEDRPIIGLDGAQEGGQSSSDSPSSSSEPSW